MSDRDPASNQPLPPRHRASPPPNQREEDKRLGITPYAGDRPLVEGVRSSGAPAISLHPAGEICVVLGRGSKVGEELVWEAIEEDRVPVYRRMGGGCSVVLDPGNLVVAAALPVPGIGQTRTWFDRCTGWMIEGLEAAGIEGVRQDGVSDLVLGDRKIAGSALYRAKDVLLFSITLLVTAELPLIERYLTHPPREPEYRAGRRHLEFVTSLREAAGVEALGPFAERLESSLDLEALLAKAERPGQGESGRR